MYICNDFVPVCLCDTLLHCGLMCDSVISKDCEGLLQIMSIYLLSSQTSCYEISIIIKASNRNECIHWERHSPVRQTHRDTHSERECVCERERTSWNILPRWWRPHISFDVCAENTSISLSVSIFLNRGERFVDNLQKSHHHPATSSYKKTCVTPLSSCSCNANALLTAAWRHPKGCSKTLVRSWCLSSCLWWCCWIFCGLGWEIKKCGLFLFYSFWTHKHKVVSCKDPQTRRLLCRFSMYLLCHP